MLATLGKLILLSNHISKTKTFELSVTKTRINFSSANLTYGFDVNLPNVTEFNHVVLVSSVKIKDITSKHELIDVSVVDTDVVFSYKYENLVFEIKLHISNNTDNHNKNCIEMDRYDVNIFPTPLFSTMVKKHEYNTRTMCNGVWLNLDAGINKSIWIYPSGSIIGSMGLSKTDFNFMFHYNFERVRLLLGKDVYVTSLLYNNSDHNNYYGVEYSDGTVYKLHEVTNNMPSRSFLEFLEKFKSFYSMKFPLMISYQEFDSLIKMVKHIYIEHKKNLDKFNTIGIRFTYDKDTCTISKYDYKKKQNEVLFEKGIGCFFDEPLSRLYNPENLIYAYELLKNKKSFVEFGIGYFNERDRVIVIKQDNTSLSFMPFIE